MRAESVVFESRKYRIVRREIPGRDGCTHAFDLIRHAGAVVVLPLLSDGLVVLIQVQRPAVDCELLELPAGTLEPGEDPLSCARRELAEETGYKAGRIEPLCSFFTTPGMTNERMHAFVATELTAGPQALEGDERITVACVPYDEALAAVRDGRIVDGKTIATLLYFDRFGRP
ncbi:MAG: NUDIX hydrolase [Phycisphaerae bacterium]